MLFLWGENRTFCLFASLAFAKCWCSVNTTQIGDTSEFFSHTLKTPKINNDPEENVSSEQAFRIILFEQVSLFVQANEKARNIEVSKRKQSVCIRVLETGFKDFLFATKLLLLMNTCGQRLLTHFKCNETIFLMRKYLLFGDISTII